MTLGILRSPPTFCSLRNGWLFSSVELPVLLWGRLSALRARPLCRRIWEVTTGRPRYCKHTHMTRYVLVISTGHDGLQGGVVATYEDELRGEQHGAQAMASSILWGFLHLELYVRTLPGSSSLFNRRIHTSPKCSPLPDPKRHWGFLHSELNVGSLVHCLGPPPCIQTALPSTAASKHAAPSQTQSANSLRLRVRHSKHSLRLGWWVQSVHCKWTYFRDTH